MIGQRATTSNAAISHIGAALVLIAASRPKSSGIEIVAALVNNMRKARAWPWRSGGAAWCSIDSTIGCTEPSAMPSTADTEEEREAWPRLVGGSEAPVLKVGEQTLRGFAPGSWGETLDTAGYPRQSLLPSSYQAPGPVPLMERKAAAPKAAPQPPAAPAADPGSNPAGIRF